MTETLDLLIVEDNIDDVELLKRMVRRCDPNWRTHVVASGREALELAQTRPFDMAFVDQHLPDTAGDQLVAQLNALFEAHPSELPVVMLTRQGDERLAVEVMKAGAYDYLRKDDLNSSLIGRTVRSVLERAVSLESLGPIDASQPAPIARAEVVGTDLPYKQARSQMIEAFEREYVKGLLDRYENNVSKAARVAGIDRVYLHRLIRKYEL